MNRSPIRQATVLISIIATIVINGLANALPINGQQTGDISDRFQVFFVPAGYVFAIWGVIYLGLIAYGIYQALPAQRDNARLASIDVPVIISGIANSAWIFLWHYEIFPLTIVAMLTLLVSLIVIYLRLGTGVTSAFSNAERWAVRLPFSIYLGWITVATVANATSLLDYLNWGGWGIGDQTWLVIMLAVALLVAAAMTLRHGDVAYLLVLVWAFAGIAIKHADNGLVSTAAWVATALVGLFVVISVLRGRSRAATPAPA